MPALADVLPRPAYAIQAPFFLNEETEQPQGAEGIYLTSLQDELVSHQESRAEVQIVRESMKRICKEPLVEDRDYKTPAPKKVTTITVRLFDKGRGKPLPYPYDDFYNVDNDL
jgi:hypothetical protein